MLGPLLSLAQGVFGAVYFAAILEPSASISDEIFQLRQTVVAKDAGMDLSLEF